MVNYVHRCVRGLLRQEAEMLSAILKGLSIWFAASIVVGHAIGALIHYEERLRLEYLSRARG